MDTSEFKNKKPMNMSSPNFYPNSYTSQSYSSQYTPKTPKSINSQTYSSQSSTLTPNSIPQRSLNNNPFETDSSNSNLTDYGIHRSNSTSKLYLKNNSLPITVSAKSDNLNSLHPPDFSHKHQNKKSSVKVYQHTRKVVNDNKSESVEVSEVTQKLYKLNGRDSQHEKSSRYSFTTYTNNENKKKVRHTLSNIEIHSYLSDSSSDNDDNDLSSSQINDSKNKKSKKEKINSIPFNKNTSIETISSQRGLEEQKENNILSEKYNEPLNYTVPANHYQNRSVDYLENNFYNAQRTINNNTNQNKTRKHHSNYGEYTYNETNYSEFDEGPVNIVITNPDNNIISSSNIYKEEESEYPESKYSSTTYNTKDNSVNRSSENSNRSNFSMKNKSQTSPLNSIAISQFNSHNNYNNEYEDSETVNESKMTYNHGNRKKHKTTTTTTTTYEIIEEDDDDDDDEDYKDEFAPAYSQIEEDDDDENEVLVNNENLSPPPTKSGHVRYPSDPQKADSVKMHQKTRSLSRFPEFMKKEFSSILGKIYLIYYYYFLRNKANFLFYFIYLYNIKKKKKKKTKQNHLSYYPHQAQNQQLMINPQ